MQQFIFFILWSICPEASNSYTFTLLVYGYFDLFGKWMQNIF